MVLIVALPTIKHPIKLPTHFNIYKKNNSDGMYMPAFPVWNAVVQIKVQMRTMNEKENTRRERARARERAHRAAAKDCNHPFELI